MEYWTALPIRNELWLCRRSDVGMQPVRPIPRELPAVEQRPGPFAMNEAGWSAFASGKVLSLLSPYPDAPLRNPRLPDDSEQIGALAFRGEILYVGCGSSWQETSRLGWFDVTEPDPTWHPLPASPQVGDPHRPVYAILVDYDRLIALDGAFTPKLALIYDIVDPRKPRYLDHVGIPSGIDDIPIDADVGRSYVAILSRSAQDTGKAWKIGIFDFDTMDEIATFYEHADWNQAIEMPLAITMYEDLLLIAQDMKGLGVVRLDDRRPSRYESVVPISPWAQSYVPVERIQYHQPLGQGHVLDVQPTSDPHTFAITVKRGGRSWWEEIVVA